MRLIKLLFLGFWVSAQEVITFLANLYRYRHCPNYLKVEVALAARYLINSPYRICKLYFKRIGEPQQPYGETPLSVMEALLERLDLQPTNLFIDLGCGRGKLLLWVACRYGCRVKGVEINPVFIHLGNKIINRLAMQQQVTLVESSIFTANLTQAAVIYLYGIAFDNETLAKIALLLSNLDSKTKIITVSDPLNEFCDPPLFETIDAIPADFIWGKTTLYVQEPL